MTYTHCPDCGFNIAAFGRMHRCIPKLAPVAANEAHSRPEDSGVGREHPRASRMQAGQPTIYKYRDPDKWREYMRDYMRRKRAGGGLKTNVPNSA